MNTCTITVQDEVWCSISGLLPSQHEVLWKTFAHHAEGYFFNPKYKLGQWDGRIRFYQKTGKTYVRLLASILPYIESWGYEIQLVDKRAYYEPVQPVGKVTEYDASGLALAAEGLDIFGDIEIRPGKVFELRPYQLQAINAAVEAGSGFVIAGTGAGKTSITAGISHLYGLKGYKIITIVPSGDLVAQTREWYELLGLDVGEYSGENKDISRTHVVATWQALQYNPSIMQEFQVLIWDECFCGDTLVLMHDLSWKKIKNVAIGELVMSQNKKGTFEPKKVTHTHHNLKKSSSSKMLRLHLSNGNYVDVTENHEFYTTDGRLVRAVDLTEEDDICEFNIELIKQDS